MPSTLSAIYPHVRVTNIQAGTADLRLAVEPDALMRTLGATGRERAPKVSDQSVRGVPAEGDETDE